MAQVKLKNHPNDIRVHTIFCVGRNYAEHAAELNNPVPGEPIIFLKPSSALIYDGMFIELPGISSDVHYETEVVALLGKAGKQVSREEALSLVAGYGIGIDVTARDIQQTAKEKSHPWTVAKGFDTFAPVSDFIPAEQIADPANIDFELRVNDEKRQQGNTGMMLFPIADLIAYLSNIFTLNAGDLIFTGTPKGVGQLQPGDRLTAVMGEGMVKLSVGVKQG